MKKPIALLGIIFLLCFSVAQLGAQSPEADFSQAKVLIEKQRFQEALSILQKLLKADPNNRDFQNAQKVAQKALDIQTSADLTAQALELVAQEKYTDAANLLKKAIALDTANKEAADMFITLTDLVKAEGESTARAKAEAEAKRKAEEQAKIAEERRKAEEAEKARLEEEKRQADAAAELMKKVLEARKSFQVNLLLDSALSYSGLSADMLDTGAFWIGPQLGFNYYLPVLDKRLGFEVFYQGSLAKISGDPWIDLLVNSGRIGMNFRTSFKEDLDNSSWLDVGMGYFLFHALNNKPAHKVYAINLAGTPYLKFALSDPTLSHFLSGAPWRFISLKAGILGGVITKETGNVYYLEGSAGVGYKLGDLEVKFLWNSQNFIQSEGLECYNHLSLGVSFEF